MSGNGLGLGGDVPSRHIERLREQRSGAQINQIATVGVQRTCILDARISLYDFDPLLRATDCGYTCTHRTELRIVGCIEKVSPARQSLRPRIQAVNRLWRSP